MNQTIVSKVGGGSIVFCGRGGVHMQKPGRICRFRLSLEFGWFETRENEQEHEQGFEGRTRGKRDSWFGGVAGDLAAIQPAVFDVNLRQLVEPVALEEAGDVAEPVAVAAPDDDDAGGVHGIVAEGIVWLMPV